MIDVAQYEADIAALPGDNLIVPRQQIHQLLAEVKSGQAAKRALNGISTFTALAVGTSAARA